MPNYTLGRGKVYMAPYVGGIATSGFRYVGNTPEFNLTIESETLDHFSSDEGIREKDDSVPLEVNRTGSLIMDDIQPANIALYFFGSETALTQAAVASATETFVDIVAGYSYQLGVTALRPTGYMGIATAGFAVEVGATPLVADVDYTMDFDAGLISLLPTSTIAVTGADLEVTYAVRASSRSRILSGSEPAEVAVRYVAKNPRGTNINYFMPRVKVSPNGDYALKSDEWMQIPFTLDIQKPSVTLEAIYADGKPAYA